MRKIIVRIFAVIIMLVSLCLLSINIFKDNIKNLVVKNIVVEQVVAEKIRDKMNDMDPLITDSQKSTIMNSVYTDDNINQLSLLYAEGVIQGICNDYYDVSPFLDYKMAKNYLSNYGNNLVESLTEGQGNLRKEMTRIIAGSILDILDESVIEAINVACNNAMFVMPEYLKIFIKLWQFVTSVMGIIILISVFVVSSIILFITLIAK
ncbi:MAG: hypothetical protein ACI4D4_01635 [Lachnospira sp.]